MFYPTSGVFIQAEGLFVELTLSSCYDFIEQSCESVLKHLSVLQKVRYGSILMTYVLDINVTFFSFWTMLVGYKDNMLGSMCLLYWFLFGDFLKEIISQDHVFLKLWSFTLFSQCEPMRIECLLTFSFFSLMSVVSHSMSLFITQKILK